MVKGCQMKTVFGFHFWTQSKSDDPDWFNEKFRERGLFCAVMQKVEPPCEMWTISKSSLLIFNLSRTNSGID